MNGLERAFWGELQAALCRHTFQQVWREPLAFRLAGNTTYKPDFMTLSSLHRLVMWETKGPYAREDSIVKLKVAASMYPCFDWVLVKQDRGKWRCTDVTSKGFARHDYCPQWLT